KATAPWMGEDAPNAFSIAVSHQDQVVSPPPGAQVIAANDFTPHGALSYAQGPAMSFQGHPEFCDGFSAALYEVRLNNPLSAEEVEAAKASLTAPEDNDLVGQWMARFYRDNARLP
ncbi:MAG: type 1 glutamine amidotransferase, partial [Pseudomonadota bacterium]